MAKYLSPTQWDLIYFGSSLNFSTLLLSPGLSIHEDLMIPLSRVILHSVIKWGSATPSRVLLPLVNRWGLLPLYFKCAVTPKLSVHGMHCGTCFLIFSSPTDNYSALLRLALEWSLSVSWVVSEAVSSASRPYALISGQSPFYVPCEGCLPSVSHWLICFRGSVLPRCTTLLESLSAVTKFDLLSRFRLDIDLLSSLNQSSRLSSQSSVYTVLSITTRQVLSLATVQESFIR